MNKNKLFQKYLRTLNLKDYLAYKNGESAEPEVKEQKIQNEAINKPVIKEEANVGNTINRSEHPQFSKEDNRDRR